MKRIIDQGYVCSAFYKVYQILERYELYINDAFYCSGDNLREIEEVIDELNNHGFLKKV